MTPPVRQPPTSAGPPLRSRTPTPPSIEPAPPHLARAPDRVARAGAQALAAAPARRARDGAAILAGDVARQESPPSLRLDGDTLRRIPDYLPVRDVRNLAGVSADVRGELRAHIDALRSADVARQVQSLAQFQRLLTRRSPHSIADLPVSLQDAPLAALAGRVLALPQPQQQQAITLLRQAANRRTPVGAVADVMQAAQQGLQALQAREWRLVTGNGLAGQEVLRGESARVVAARHGISSPGALQLLALSAVDAARRLVEAGHRLPHVFAATGIDDARVQREVAFHALRNVALPAVRQGDAPEDVMQRTGLMGDDHRRQLVAAARNVANQPHEDPGPAVQRAGVAHDMAAQARERLEAGRAAVAAGDPVPLAAARFGLDHRVHIRDLESVAVEQVGIAQVRRGANAQHVAMRLGVFDPDQVGRLRRAQIPPQGGLPQPHAQAEAPSRRRRFGLRLGVNDPEQVDTPPRHDQDGPPSRRRRLG